MDPLADGCIDLGGGHFWRWLQDGDAIWRHPGCQSWFLVDLTTGTHHSITKGSHGDLEGFTIHASLLCPIGCGDHGFVREGKWVAA